MRKKKASAFLCTALCVAMISGCGTSGVQDVSSASASVSAGSAMKSASTITETAAAKQISEEYAEELTNEYKDPDREDQSYVRWWLPQASLTDKQLKEEVQEIYDAGFDGAELCMQTSDAPTDQYAYGSDMWSHKWKLLIEEFLDHNMSVSLTAGTNWATANVPGLDPDSQEASQVVAMGAEIVEPGQSITELPKPETMHDKATFIGAYAYKIEETGKGEYKSVPSKPWVQPVDYEKHIVDESTMQEITGIQQGDTVWDQKVNWTAPDGEVGENDAGKYYVVAYWQQGNYHTSEPSTETAYATNYFDKRGVEALKKFWEEHYLNDQELNEKIRQGDVMLFMDSIELNPTGGIIWYTDFIRDEFKKRKGYDILPYMFLLEGLPEVYAVFDVYTAPASGYNSTTDTAKSEKIVNDYLDVLTQLYEENMLKPLKEWLNSYGIKTRAQISYGRSFEITEPSAYVDYPEAENLQEYNQIDILRLHTAGAKLQNKTLSMETGGTLDPYTTTMQMRLKSVYGEYAAGFQKVVWHIWSATDSYGTDKTNWPGDMPMTPMAFDRWDNREPAYEEYDELNAHIGRIQHLMKEGNSRTDIGFIHNNWNQGLNSYGGRDNTVEHMNNMLAHMGVYYRSTELQDNGYTYDYLSPDLLDMDTVFFDEETKTIEPAGYKALVIYQKWLDPDGAKKILDWAKKGLPVVVMEGAARETPFNDGRDDELAETMAELEKLDNVKVAAINDADEGFDYFSHDTQGYDDDVYECMQELGVQPYCGYDGANHQILTQSREGSNGVRYLYAYNYCSDDYHQNSYIDSVKNESHGTECKTNLVLDGEYEPYVINAWTGETQLVANYEIRDGQTYVPIDIKYDDIALYAFRPMKEETLHATATTADSVVQKNGKLYAKAFSSGDYSTELSDGSTVETKAEVPDSYDITNWDVNVESWSKGDNLIIDEETIDGLKTVNSQYETKKTAINVKLDKLKTWNNIPEVGDKVSGTASYKATFNWDASKADGAVLDFGDSLVSTMEVWINGKKVGGDVSTNPSKSKTVIADGSTGREQYTGGISFKDPKADVSEYLKDGENTIEVKYSSTLGNVEIANGGAQAKEADWWGYDTSVEAYGPVQAVLHPYTLTSLT